MAGASLRQLYETEFGELGKLVLDHVFILSKFPGLVALRGLPLHERLTATYDTDVFKVATLPFLSRSWPPR
jgi:hypothetical protein